MRAAETVPTICVQASERERASRQSTRRLFFCFSLLAAASGQAWLDTELARAQPAPEEAAPLPAPPPPAPFASPPVVTGPSAPEATVHAEAPYQEPALAEPKPLAAPPPPPMLKAEPPPPPKEEKPSILKPVLKVGFGLRSGIDVNVNNPSPDVKVSLSDGLVDQVLVRPYFSAQITEMVGVVANLQFGTGKPLAPSLLDAIVQLKIADEFQIWGGQHIPANDRLNFQGPFFNNGWNFEAPGVQAFPFDNGARDRGFTFWGLIAGGFLKYHLSMVDLQPGRSIQNASFAARAQFNFLDKENYYYTSGTYYGAQDTLAIGGVVRGQKGTGIIDPTGTRTMAIKGENDFFGGGVDLLAEKRFASGTYTLQAQYTNMNGTDIGYVVNQGTVDSGNGVSGPHPGQSLYAEVSWLSPTKLGAGQLQPNFHFTWADHKATNTTLCYDVGLGYIVDGFNHRWYINYRHIDADTGGKQDILQLGAQIQI
jgi:hypothetical protein